jgi:hypothetical protein
MCTQVPHSAKHHLPIYALNVLSQKIYVVNSPDLIAAVQRNTKSLSFGPLIIEVSRRMLNVPNETAAQIAKNQFGDESGYSYMLELHNAQYGVLAPGQPLDQMNVDVLSRMLPFINDIKNNEEPISLLPFLRHIFTIAGAYALLGPSSPFENNPDLEKAMWDFAEDGAFLIMDLMPNITASKGHKGRAKMIKALQEYYNSGGLKNASKLLQERHRVGSSSGMTSNAMAHLDTGLVFGLLINSVPSVFWLTTYICSYPSLLADIREELDAVITHTSESHSGTPIVDLDVSQIRQHCPVFCSTYQEVLRLISSHSTGRMVVKDTVIADHYFLKEGAVVQMPGSSVHLDPKIWGPDVRDFKPRRFINSKIPATAFRAFGGGNTMCPGRHFAFTEIMSLVAVLVMGFDISPVEGEWKLPRQDYAKMPLGVATPKNSVDVYMKPASGFEDVEWRFIGGGATASR